LGLKGSFQVERDGTRKTLNIARRVATSGLHLPFLDINGYYNFLSTAMIALFIIGLVIIFVYEYEALRRSKT
jgi:hypothetical protein